MQAIGFAPAITGVELGAAPVGNVGLLQVVEKGRAFQLLDLGIEQARDRRIGETHAPALVHHQDALGSVVQHRGIEGPRHLQVVAEVLQGPAVALMLQQGLDLGLENLWVERFEQVVHGATGIALDHGVLRLFVGGEKDDRGQPGTLAATHQAGDFEAIHAGHLYIQQHQVHFMFEQQAQGLDPRGGGHHLPVLALQQSTHAEEVFRIVIDDQKSGVAFGCLWLHAFHAASLVCNKTERI